MTAANQRLPYVDERSTEIATNPETVWDAVLQVVEGSFGSIATGRVARLLGCADVSVSGPRPLTTGSALPGFHVEFAQRPHELVLAGSHRFSDYALTFRLEEVNNQHTRLRAETHALFPGIRGAAYETLVIRSRGHILATRRLVSAIKRRAERGYRYGDSNPGSRTENCL